MTKPMLASDADEAKIRYPVGIQPKIDGVRALNIIGKLTGRSLKTHGNRYTTNFFSHSCLLGLDGELAAEHECHPDLCRITTSAVSSHEGNPYVVWWLFDFTREDIKPFAYKERYSILIDYVRGLRETNPEVWSRLRVVPMVVVNSYKELLDWETKWLEAGFEGLIIRDLDGKYKDGRSTVREMGLLRIKRFIEEEAIVLSIEEGRTNMNLAKKNELGLTERSSHQENMIPNEMVGNLRCQIVKDICDPYDKTKILFSAGQICTVAPGKMTDEEAMLYFQNPSLIVGKTIKFKFFPKGIKDKPRFPTFQSIRAESDK